MCGHVGIAGDLKLSDEKTMKRLLLFDYLRGPDSTGIAVKSKTTDDVRIVKMASHPLDLFDSKHFTAALSAYSSEVFLGHNRAATKGKVSTINAHPFECGHIIGAHNGTLENASWVELDKLCGVDTEVDSHAIFLSIEKHGIEETMKHVYGAWALVWINLEDGTLNFLRNSKRTLYYCLSEDKTKLMWASEYPMMRCAMDLSDVEYPLYTDKEGFAFFSFPENVHYSWKLADLRNKDLTSKPIVKKMKEREVPKPPVTNFTNNTPTTNTTQSTQTKGSGTTTFRSEDHRIPLQGDNDNPFADVIGVDKFAELAQHGCSYCSEEIKYEDEGVTIMFDDDLILCNSCSGGRTETRIYVDDEAFEFLKKAL